MKNQNEKYLKMNKKLIDFLISSGAIKTKKVKEAFLKTPRHLFIESEYAYEDMPLPSIKGQTISQPSIVAYMIENLDLRKNHKVLEVGAGTGWSAALISRIVYPGKVFTIEIDEDLVELAKKNISKLNIKNVEIIHRDGSLGYEKEAPYDRCIVTAACPRIPPPLIQQLKENGKLISPVGNVFYQNLILFDKEKNEIKNLGGCVFVKMKGKFGFNEEL